MVTARSYLLSSVGSGLNVVNAYHPLTFGRQEPAALMPAFAAGLPVSELPLLFAAERAITTARSLRTGVAHDWRGAFGIALSAAAVAGLVGLHLDARRSAVVLEEALAAELGADYRARIRWSPASSTRSAPLERRSVPLSLLRDRRRLLRAANRDLAYGEEARNRLDVWRRADLPDDAGAPVVLQFPGGAWITGDKTMQALPLLAHLAARGWVCVAVNYGLAPATRWPAIIADVKRAIAWTKANITRFGGDPRFVAVTGGSAGAHLSSLAALTAGDPGFQPGFEGADTSVQAAVPLYGVYDWTGGRGTIPILRRFVGEKLIGVPWEEAPELFRRGSPVERVHDGAPPFLVIHGANDSLVFSEQAQAFVERLRAASKAAVVYAELPRAQHAFDAFRSVRTMHTVRAVERFLGVVYGDHVASTPRVGAG